MLFNSSIETKESHHQFQQTIFAPLIICRSTTYPVSSHPPTCILGRISALLSATNGPYNPRTRDSHLQVHCPVGQAQEVPQLHEQPGPTDRKG